MTNAEKFKNIFGLYATELWAKSEKEFLKWLNTETQETYCENLVDKQAAIYALTNFITPHDNGDGTMTVGVLSKSSITDILNDLSPVQSEPSQVARDIATILENEKDMRVIKKNAESESCADTISRQDAIRIVERFYRISEDIRRKMAFELRQLPSTQPQRKKGKWIKITTGAMREKYMCSICGRIIEEDGIEKLVQIRYPFCHCGAEMTEE